jgi:tetratricopeptide (TPR) repeat protein
MTLRESLGPQHLEVARFLHALGFRYQRLGEHANAAALYAEALAIQEAVLGAEAPELATTLDDYAKVLHHVGRHAEAQAAEWRAASIRAR